MEIENKSSLHQKVHDSCKGCGHIVTLNDQECCACYINPSVFWTYDRRCPMATHIKVHREPESKKKQLPLMPKSPKSKFGTAAVITPKRLRFRKGR